MKQKVLLIRFSAFGDIVLTTGPLLHLKSRFPDHEIHFLTSEIGDELLTGSLEIDEVFVVPRGSNLGELIKIYRDLPDYDMVIDWQDNFKSWLLKFFVKGKFFKIKKHSRQRRQFVRDKKNRPELQQHVVEKYFATLKRAFDLPDQSLEELRPTFQPRKLIINQELFDMQKAVALHSYASVENKVWPYFSQLIEKLQAQKTPVILVGNTPDPQTYQDGPLLLDLRNKTPLRELAAVLSHCRALVTTDSGPMHLGIAVNTPTIALFGPTTKEFGFYPKFSNTFVLENNELDCRPCHVHGGDSCPLEHHNCMKTISVDDVMKKIDEMNF